MDYCQYNFSCTSCGSEIVLVSLEVNPIMVQCPGCGRFVIINGGSLYTVSLEFFKEIAKNHKLKFCGQLVGTTIKRQDTKNSLSSNDFTEKKPISQEDIEDLHRFLEMSDDSLEILKKYW